MAGIALAAAIGTALLGAGAQSGGQQPDMPTAEWMTGTWSDHKDCSKAFMLEADGTMITVGGKGKWRLEGRDLVLANTAGEEKKLTIRRTGRNSLQLIANGVPSYRCLAAAD